MRRWPWAVFVLGATLRAGVAQDVAVPQPSGDAPPSEESAPRSPAPRARPEEEAAADVLAAIASGDEAGLRRLATRNLPNPWTVADELCLRGAHDAALAFATVVQRPDVERLAGYVESRRGAAPDVVARKRLVDAMARAEAGDAAGALAILRACDVAGDPLVAVRVAAERGAALCAVGRHAEGAAELRAAAEAAEAMGWWARAAVGHDDAGAAALAAGDRAAAARSFSKVERLAERRGGRIRDELRRGVPRLVVAAAEKAAETVAPLEAELRVAEAAGDPAATARLLLRIGDAHVRGNRGADALTAYERALALLDPVRDRAITIECVARLADLRERTDNARALELWHRLRTLCEEAGDESGRAGALLGIAAIHFGRGGYEPAEKAYREAMEIAERLGQRRRVASCLRGLGRIAERRRQFPEAVELQQRSLAIAEELRDASLIRSSLRGLAITCRSQGDLEGAQRHGERLLELAPDDVEWNGQMAEIRYQAGRWEEGGLCAARATNALRGQLRGYDPAESAVARDSDAYIFEAGFAAATRLRDPALAAYFLESARSDVLLEELQVREFLARRQPPPEARQAEDSARARQAAAARALREAIGGGDRAAIEVARAEVKAARLAAEAVAQRAHREAKAAAEFDVPPPDALDAIRARLAPDEAFVSYGLVRDGRLRMAMALVATRDYARVVRLGTRVALVAACEPLVAPDASADLDAAVAELRRLVIAPLGLDPGVRRVLVSPHRELASVPFPLLLPGRDVCLVPSGTVHGWLVRQTPPKGEGVLAVGDPDYDLPGAAGAVTAQRGGFDLARIPATGDEARAVGDVVLTRGDATEEGFREALAGRRRWRAVHLAAHGLADDSAPLASAVALTPAGGDDGLLSALEVYRMDVPADLVVLSGCSTAKGHKPRAGGIAGLAAAFLYAGAPRVVVSLWKVDDRATAALMAKFYEGWRAGVPAARALREAQEFVRSHEAWAHPVYWAPWTLWGLPE
jgi:tetratricopeptide (TPR) repeat protein